MGKKTLKKGELLHSTDNIMRTVEIVISGGIRIIDGRRSIMIGSGGLTGALETPGSPYSYRYEAAEDTVVFEYPCTKESDIEKIIASNPRIIPNMVNAALSMYMSVYKDYEDLADEAEALHRFLSGIYETYLSQCGVLRVTPESASWLDDIGRFVPEEEVSSWKLQYYNAMRTLPQQLRTDLYSSSIYTGLGIIMGCIRDTQQLLNVIREAVEYMTNLISHAVSGEQGDLFDLFSSLLFIAGKNPFADTMQLEAAASKLIIYLTDSPYMDIRILHERVSAYRKTLKDIEEAGADRAEAPVEKDAYEALTHSLITILTYSGIPADEMQEFSTLIDRFRLLQDKSSTEDDARKLRRAITDRFYKIYEAAFFRSVHDMAIPAAVRMFFCFGYMDEELCGMDNASILFELVQDMKPDWMHKIMTMYDWLLKIYNGEEMPSKNEFDLDYPAFLREQKNNGDISAEEEKRLLNDRTEKVRFEIKNFFTLGNRITFGRITTFCPVLCDSNIVRPLRSIYLTPEKVHEVLGDIRQTDFSCFYREVMYTNPAAGINQEYIHKEVLPNIILLPNVGSKGALWQETSGIRRDTPGRIMLSIFPVENVTDIMLRISAEFRWELCKKIQGVHWNDVTDPSLTAEYCDYMQFYKKNRELSNDAKEKIKLQLHRARNNYREAFVSDYIQWFKFESQGSPRLNKVARSIMVRYVPFPSAMFTQAASNPMYKEHIDKRNVKLSQRLHTLNLLTQKLQSQGLKVPGEITAEINYLNI